MQEIKCPKCGEVFQVDEAGYAAILKQVRDEEFRRELAEQRRQMEKESRDAAALAQMKAEKALQEALSQRDKQLSALRAQMADKESEFALREAQTRAEQQVELQKLQARLAAGEQEKQLAMAEALREKEKLLSARETAIVQLEGKLQAEKSSGELRLRELQNDYEQQLSRKDAEVKYYRDFKQSLSTKMVGESLERHCEDEFNRLRATGFQNAYFEKDNDARSGSKGDYIYRETTPDGIEVVSIMFEMKNEMEDTAVKKKNEDFLRELDKDRREKGCEYAVLVSLLERDSELYNTGIVDMSHRYEKMYVIRPQFFIPMITLLRNAAMRSLDYRRELETVRAQNIDITNFENEMNEFKEKFARNYRLASERFKTAIDEIDKTILHLQKTKDALLSSENNLRLAGNKAEELSIKRLTRNNPTMREKFAALAPNGEEE